MEHSNQTLHAQCRAMNLDTTANCPVAVECAQCGCTDRDSLDASTIDTDIGVACLKECVPTLAYPHIAEMVLDHCSIGRRYSRFLRTCLLDAATDGQLIGDDLRSTAPDLVVRLGGCELTQPEYRVLADLLCSDHLVWIGQRITVTAAGRELLNRPWADRPYPATGGRGVTYRQGADRP